MSDQEVQLGVTLCWASWKEDPPAVDGQVEEVAKRAFRMARDDSYTWFTRSDDEQFRIGCGLILMHYKDSPVFAQIENTLHALKCLSALTQGVPVDLAAAIPEEMEMLPLILWYRKTEGTRGA